MADVAVAVETAEAALASAAAEMTVVQFLSSSFYSAAAAAQIMDVAVEAAEADAAVTQVVTQAAAI